MRTCSHCHARKSARAFRVQRRKGGATYRLTQCRACESELARARKLVAGPRRDNAQAACGWLLDAAPLAAWIGARSLTRLAERADVEIEMLRRIRNGHAGRVTLHTADRILTRGGAHLMDVYPELYPAVAA